MARVPLKLSRVVRDLPQYGAADILDHPAFTVVVRPVDGTLHGAACPWAGRRPGGQPARRRAVEVIAGNLCRNCDGRMIRSPYANNLTETSVELVEHYLTIRHAVASVDRWAAKPGHLRTADGGRNALRKLATAVQPTRSREVFAAHAGIADDPAFTRFADQTWTGVRRAEDLARYGLGYHLLPTGILPSPGLEEMERALLEQRYDRRFNNAPVALGLRMRVIGDLPADLGPAVRALADQALADFTDRGTGVRSLVSLLPRWAVDEALVRLSADGALLEQQTVERDWSQWGEPARPADHRPEGPRPAWHTLWHPENLWFLRPGSQDWCAMDAHTADLSRALPDFPQGNAGTGPENLPEAFAAHTGQDTAPDRDDPEQPGRRQDELDLFGSALGTL